MTKTILPMGVVTCGQCGRPVRRVGQSETQEYTGVPMVASRTLVDGNFLPSCSDECLGMLRAKIGALGRIPKRSYLR